MRDILDNYIIAQSKSKIKAGEGKNKGKYKFFNSSNVQTKFYDEYQYDKPALIFGTGGNASIHYCDEPFSTSTDCIVFYARNESVDLKLIYIFISSNMHLLESGFKGIGIKHISKSYIQNIEIKIPGKEVQSTITKSFDQICDLISRRKEQLSKLDELVKARFVELFGDVIRNDKGWEQYTFSDITTSRLGKMLDAKQQTGKYAYPYLANFNVQWFRFEIENLNKMDFNDADRQEFELCDGDLLVCEGGEIGRCAVWHNEIQPCYFQKALHRVRCNQHIVLPDYMAWWFKYNCGHKGFAAIEGAKATIAHLPGVKLKALKVTVPPIELQNQFVAFLKQTDKSKLKVQNSLEKLELLKKALMQKYFG